MASGVSIPVGVTDKASGPIDRIRDRFDTLGKSGGVKSFTTGLGLGAGVGVFNLATQALSGVASAMGDMVKGAIDDAESVGRLQKTLDNSIPSWRTNAKAIDERILAGQKLAFTDDQMRDSLGSLATRTKDMTQAMNLQRIAMGLARARNMDLNTAANLVGKVYSGNVGILARYGIAVDKGASSTEALTAIQKMASGQAETYGKSTKGSMEAIGIAMAEVGESIGAALIPVLEALIPIIRDKIVPIIQTFATILGGLLEVLAPVIGFIADVAIAAFQAWAEIILSAGEALLSVAAAIPGPWQEGASAMKDAIGNMKKELTNLTGSATSVAEDVGPQVGGALAEGAGDVEEGAEEAFGTIPGQAEEQGKEAVKSTRKALGAVIGEIRASQNDFVNAWKGALDVTAREEEIAVQLVANAAERKAQIKILKSEESTKAERREARRRLAELQASDSALLAEQSTYGDTATQITRTKALLASKALVDGLHDSDPQVRAYWRAVRNEAISRLTKLENEVPERGRALGSNWGDAVDSAQARKALTSSIDTLRGKARTAFQVAEDRAPGWGTAVSIAWSDGLRTQRAIQALQRSARLLIAKLAALLEGGSPTKEGPLHFVDVWGANVGRAWSEGLSEGMTAPNLARVVPGLKGGSPGSAPTGSAGTAVYLTVEYAPTISTGSPAEMDRAARTLGPAIVRELRARGALPAGSY